MISIIRFAFTINCNLLFVEAIFVIVSLDYGNLSFVVLTIEVNVLIAESIVCVVAFNSIVNIRFVI